MTTIDEINKILANTKNKIIAGKKTTEIMVVIQSEDIDDKIISELKNIPEIKSIYLFDGERRKLVYGSPVIYDKIGRFKFQISPDSPEEISADDQPKYDRIKKLADVKIGDEVLVLYCGVGIIPIYLSTLAKKVTGIDPNPIAIRDAKDNARINKINNCQFICTDPNNIAMEQFSNYIVITCNKLPKKLIKTINTTKLKSVIYT